MSVDAMIVACHMLIIATRVSNWRRGATLERRPSSPSYSSWVGLLKSNKVAFKELLEHRLAKDVREV
jgi:hypothetical protein